MGQITEHTNLIWDIPVQVVVREIKSLQTSKFTMPDSYSRNGGIFTVRVAGVEGVPTVGVLGPQQPSRPYRWYCRGGW